jgi:hypothetical protein
MTITETQSTSVFVSFAAFCSNFLLFLLLSFDRDAGDGRCIWLHHLDFEDEDDQRAAEGPTG